MIAAPTEVHGINVVQITRSRRAQQGLAEDQSGKAVMRGASPAALLESQAASRFLAQHMELAAPGTAKTDGLGPWIIDEHATGHAAIETERVAPRVRQHRAHCQHTGVRQLHFDPQGELRNIVAGVEYQAPLGLVSHPIMELLDEIAAVAMAWLMTKGKKNSNL